MPPCRDGGLLRFVPFFISLFCLGGYEHGLPHRTVPWIASRALPWAVDRSMGLLPGPFSCLRSIGRSVDRSMDRSVDHSVDRAAG